MHQNFRYLKFTDIALLFVYYRLFEPRETIGVFRPLDIFAYDE